MKYRNTPAFGRFSLLLLILLFQGCQSLPKKMSAAAEPLPAPQKELFKPVENIPSAEQIFALTEQQKQSFLSYFNDPRHTHIPAHRRLYDYLNVKVHGFDYKGDTLIAQEVFDTNSGNCLSLAILTSALADLTGIEFEYQLVNAAPVYRLENKLMMTSRHVRTILYDPDFVPEEQVIYIQRPSLTIDYFPRRGDRHGQKVDRQNLIAMYYQNLAAEAMIDDDLALANVLIMEGLSHAPLNSHSLNILAVIYNKAGHPQWAETIYQYALRYEAESVDLLDNYRHFLRRQDRIAEAQRIESRLGKVDENNPFRFLQLAEQAFSGKDYMLAARLFRKAKSMAPYMEQPHFGLARSYSMLGEVESAVRAMESAIKATYRDQTRDLYYAKLNSLKTRAGSR